MNTMFILSRLAGVAQAIVRGAMPGWQASTREPTEPGPIRLLPRGGTVFQLGTHRPHRRPPSLTGVARAGATASSAEALIVSTLPAAGTATPRPPLALAATVADMRAPPFEAWASADGVPLRTRQPPYERASSTFVLFPGQRTVKMAFSTVRLDDAKDADRSRGHTAIDHKRPQKRRCRTS